MFEMTPFRRENNGIARGDDYFNQFFRNFFGDNFDGLMEMNQSLFKVDIRESNDANLIEAELPGVKKENIIELVCLHQGFSLQYFPGLLCSERKHPFRLQLQ